MDMDTQMRRFEQQLSAFEKLHANELNEFQGKLAAYIRLHAEEVKFLREQLGELKQSLKQQAQGSDPRSHVENAREDPRP
ncbi:MAG: hypothetical protein ACT4QE_25570 [Anaerolineales bacterium]